MHHDHINTWHINISSFSLERMQQQDPKSIWGRVGRFVCVCEKEEEWKLKGRESLALLHTLFLSPPPTSSQVSLPLSLCHPPLLNLPPDLCHSLTHLCTLSVNLSLSFAQCLSPAHSPSLWIPPDVDECARMCQTHMGWLRLVGSLNLHVSFAQEPYKRDDILQKRPII